jgi:hypothetical protein
MFAATFTVQFAGRDPDDRMIVGKQVDRVDQVMCWEF